LCWAVGANYFDRVKLLVENGVDVNRPSRGRTPYEAAISNGHQEIADYLVAQGAKPEEIRLSKAEEFSIACYRDDVDRVRQFVASDPSLLDDAEGLLTELAESTCVNSVRLLVELGVDVNGKAGCESPLQCAARAGQLETVKLLVELGADVHARDTCWNSPALGFANYKGQRHVVDYLLQFAPICDAVKYGGLDRVRTLLREDPDCVIVRDNDGRTPLYYPNRDTRHGAQIIELLIAHGADTSAKDNAGRTPLDQMLQNGRPDLAEVLRRSGSDST
jgi:ankyrin repeat protein